MMCYIHSTLKLKHMGWVGDGIEDVLPHLFADADFAGCVQSSRSTSGSFLCVRGPATFFPIAMQSKRQGCVSHSTPGAELVAADHAVTTEGVPAISFWESILRREAKVIFEEDN